MEDVFIPQKYLTHMEVLDSVPNHGKGIRIPSSKLNEALKTGRVHFNAVLNRDIVYIVRETCLT